MLQLILIFVSDASSDLLFKFKQFLLFVLMVFIFLVHVGFFLLFGSFLFFPFFHTGWNLWLITQILSPTFLICVCLFIHLPSKSWPKSLAVIPYSAKWIHRTVHVYRHIMMAKKTWPPIWLVIVALGPFLIFQRISKHLLLSLCSLFSFHCEQRKL